MSVLAVRDIRKSFGGLQALDGASLSVREGSITGLIGPNGSGKTTLFNIITGYESVDSGSVAFRDQPVAKLRPDRVCRMGIGRTFQLTRIFGGITARQNLSVGSRAVERSRRRELYAAERLDQLLDFVGLSRLQHELAGTLSYGQRKLLELAIILAQDSKVILLDEPAGGINPSLISQLSGRIKELNEQGVTFLIVEHNMEFVMGICHEVAVMERGRVICVGTPEEVRNDPRVLDAYLGGAATDAAPAEHGGDGAAATAASNGGSQ